MKYALALLTQVASVLAFAGEAPQSFTYQGKIYKSNGVDPVEAPAVTFKVQIRSPDGLCLLFEETYLRDLTGTGGLFTLIVGEGSNTNASTLSLKQVFDNGTSKTGAGGCVYTPVAGDTRRIRFSYNDGVESITLPTDQTVRSVPYALNASTIQGLSKNQLIQVSTQTTQAKVDAVMAASADLLALANGTSSNYTDRTYTDSKLGGQNLDLAGISNGQSLVWNATQSKWQASSPTNGTLTSVTAGAGLSGGVITGSGTIALSTVGVAGSYTKVTTDSYGRVTAGTSLVETDLPTLISAGKVSGDALTSGTIAGSTAINTTGAIATTGAISTTSTMTATNLSATTGSLQILRVFDSTNAHKVTLSVPGSLAANYNLVLPGAAGTAGQLLTTDGSGNMSWSSPSSLLSGSAGGDLSGTFPNPTVAKVQGVAVSATAPSSGQVYRYNGASLAPAYVNALELKSSAGLAQLPTSCSSSQTMTYSSVTDTFVCSTIAIASTAVTGLGTSSAKNAPATGDASSSEVVLGNDSRLTNSRTPTGAAGGDLAGTFPSPTLTTTGIGAGTYTKLTVDSKGRATAGALLTSADIPSLSWTKMTSDVPTTLSGYGITDAVRATGGVTSLQSGLESARPAASVAGRIYFATDSNKIFFDSGSAWQMLASAGGAGGTLTALTGDVTASGTGSVASTVSSVGGSTAANLHSAEVLANAAVSTNTASTLVKRDASGNFAAGTATINGLVVKDSGSNSITLLAPTTVSSSYQMRLPSSVGTSGQIMTTNGSGDLSWLSVSGDGSMSSSGALSVTKIRGVAVASASPSSGNIMKYDGSAWTPVALGLSDLKSSQGGSLFSAPSCTAIQTLSWSSITDAFTCISIQDGSSSQKGLLQVGSGLSSTSGVISLAATGISAGTYRSLSVDTQGRVTAASNPTTIAEYGLTDAIKNNGGVTGIQSGLEAAKPAAGTAGRLYVTTDTGKILRDNGTTWDVISTATGTGGTVTSVAAGTGLTGGTIATSGTLAVDVGTTANKVVQLDSSARLPAVDGSQLTNLPVPPFSNMVVHDASVTWTPPTGVTKVYVQIWGGGGGGAGGATSLSGLGGSGGGGGSYAAGIFTLTSSAGVTITIGSGGTKGSANAAGTAGNATSFGTYISAGGGAAGQVAAVVPTVGGVSSAVLNIVGGAGLPATGNIGGIGGSAGNGGGAGGVGSYITTNNASAGTAPGGGGGGGYGALATTSTGGNGAAGRVIIWW